MSSEDIEYLPVKDQIGLYMTIDEFTERMLALGYKRSESNSHENGQAVFYKRSTAVHDCICNEKQPQLVVKIFDTTIHGHRLNSAEIELVAENPVGWVNFKFYSILPTEFFDKREQMELELMKAWDATFIPIKND